MSKNRKKPQTNRNIMVIVYVTLAVFIGVIAYIVCFQLFQAKEIINNSYNPRQSLLTERVIRGDILASDGTTVLAHTKVTDEQETREYPMGSIYSHVVGYMHHGGLGLENDAAYYLLESDQNIFQKLGNDFTGNRYVGNNVVTTLDSGLQKAAYDALGDQRGAVVIMEPSTGKILAMVSKPDFDPTTLEEEWDIINTNTSDAVLYNRATQGLYPPGSTFKIVTMLEYLREHPEDYQDYTYTCDGTVVVSDQTIQCHDNLVHGEQDLFLSFANSCNTSFVNIGNTLDLSDYRKTAESLLFNKELPLSMAYQQSSFRLTEESSEWEISQTAFGQGETLITPMHLALIGSSIANEGILMKPYLIDHITNAGGGVISQFQPQEYKRLMMKEEAGLLSKAMENMVDVSLDWLYGDCSYEVAAKTGTAQYNNSNQYHSLFVSFSPVEQPEIVVVTVLEGEGRHEAASETTKKIYDYYYGR